MESPRMGRSRPSRRILLRQIGRSAKTGKWARITVKIGPSSIQTRTRGNEVAGHRVRVVICRECRKPVRGRAVECPGCLHQFHPSCLTGRVRRREWGVSYRICRKCLEEKRVDRIVTDDGKRPGRTPG